MHVNPITFKGLKMLLLTAWVWFTATVNSGLAQESDSKPNHVAWTRILQVTVDDNTGLVNYEKGKNLTRELNTYLEYLATFDPNLTWPKNRFLAYYINLYNALTVKLILDHYPVKSIRDIQNPWGQNLITIYGTDLSLDDIEHKILRTLDEPRIHFAINCASISCPKLFAKAYTELGMEYELNQAVSAFFNDPDKFRIKGDTLYLSPILKWYRSDFESVYGSLINCINHYHALPFNSETKIRFLSYNWNLNESHP